MTFQELSSKNIALCREVYPKACTMAPERLAAMLAHKMGDVCTLLKSLQAGEDIDTHSIGQQFAETIICADLLCWRFGINLGDAVAERFNADAEKRGSSARLGEKKWEI